MLIACLLAIAGCQPSGPDPRPSDQPDLPARPNILWLVAEDLSPIVPPFGDSTVATPNLSRLAAEGIRYTHAFSPSGVCAPSRAAIATGMYPNHIGAHHMRTGGRSPYHPPGIVPYEAVPPPEVKMHSQYLREAGYYTTNNPKEDYNFRKPVTAWDESSRQAHWRNRATDQPFFAIFNFFVTHESQVWTRAGDSLWVDEDLDVPVPPYLPDNETGRRDIRQTYSNIVQMDRQVGEILRQLEEDDLIDSTVIFWFTDHGGPLPRQKRMLYDSGIRVPLIIRFPDGWRAGEVDDQLVSFIDFKPTILSLAGVAPPEHLDGRAFLGAYAASTERTYVHAAADRFDAVYDMVRAVRDNRYKYIRNYRPEKPTYLPVSYREQMPIMQELLRMRNEDELDDQQALWFRPTKAADELYDTVADPHEMDNLATTPHLATKLSELRAEMDRWMTEIEDKGLIDEAEFIESIWPGSVQPETVAPVVTLEGQTVTLRSVTAGASIGYQVLASDAPVGETWKVYTKPLAIPSSHRIVAVAHRIGYKPSAQVSYSLADPTDHRNS